MNWCCELWEKKAYTARKPGGGRKKLKLEYDAGKTCFTLKWFHDIIISINDEFVNPFLLGLWRCRNDGKEKITNWDREF